MSVPETLRLKSGAWDEQGTFLYSTAAHLKFALPPPPPTKDQPSPLSKGDSGIVRTLDRPIYVAAVHSGKALVTVLDRTGKVREVPVDVTEYAFKRALALRKYDEVLRMVKGKVISSLRCIPSIYSHLIILCPRLSLAKRSLGTLSVRVTLSSLCTL